MTVRNSANALLTRLLNKTLAATVHKAAPSTSEHTEQKVLPKSASILGFAQLPSNLPSNKASGGSPPLWFPFRKKK